MLTLVTFVQERHDNVGFINRVLVGITQINFVVVSVTLGTLFISILSSFQFLVNVQ